MNNQDPKTFIVSDIHGMGSAYLSMFKDSNMHRNLGKNEGIIDMSKDRLIILGDVIDRGADSFKILLDIIKRKEKGEDICFILGNHELMLLQTLDIIGIHDLKMGDIEEKVLPFIMMEAQVKNLTQMNNPYALQQLAKFNNISSYLAQKGIYDSQELIPIAEWLVLNNSLNTYRQFEALKPEIQFKICEFLENSIAQMLIKVGKNNYVLSHACPYYDPGFISYFQSNWKDTVMPYSLVRNNSRLTHQLFWHRNDGDNISNMERQHMLHYNSLGINPIIGHTPHKDRVIYDERVGSLNIDAGCGSDGGKCAVLNLTDNTITKIDPYTGKVFKPRSVEKEIFQR